MGLSPAAVQLVTPPFGPERPLELWDAWDAGLLTVDDLHEVIPLVWPYRDAPGRELSADKWVVMLRAAGMIISPSNLPPLPNALTLYRGATAERQRSMSWYLEREPAEEMVPRHAPHGDASVFVTRISASRVLAHLKRLDEEPEVLLDPAEIGEIEPD